MAVFYFQALAIDDALEKHPGGNRPLPPGGGD